MGSAHALGRVIMPERGYTDIPTYLSGKQMCALYDMDIETFYKLRVSPWLPDPDVAVGRKGGWSMERALRFGKETGRLDGQGRPSEAIRRGKPRGEEEPPGWYRMIPKRYLSARDASLLMGLNKDGMFRLKRRNDYPRPAAIIGGEGRVEGWEEKTCLKFAVRYGYLTPKQLEQIEAERVQEAAQLDTEHGVA